MKIGDTVFVVYGNGRNATYNATVEKIGRKWATLSGHHPKMDIETWTLWGGQYASPGSCYRNEKEYKDKVLISKTWAEFRSRLAYLQPPNVTVQRIREIAKEFGIDIPTDNS